MILSIEVTSCVHYLCVFEHVLFDKNQMTSNTDSIWDEFHVHNFCVVAPLFHFEKINGTENKHLDILQLGAVEVDPVLSQFPDHVDYMLITWIVFKCNFC